jgi:hypothetical protein
VTITIGARTAVIVPDAVAPSPPAAHYTRYALLDRGSYDHAPFDDAELLARLATLAAEVTGRALAVRESRVVRLVPGDYLLAHHDSVHDDLPIEVVADLSPAAVPGAEVHYRRRGQVFFRVPSTPGAVSIVERGPTVTCNHTYVSKLLPPGTEVVRVIALLREPV